MRGYEPEPAILQAIREGGYESPCGVMSPLLEFVNRVFHELRIPMRGYEHSSTVALSNPSHVTNPHAGL